MLSPVLDIGVVGTVNRRTKTVPLQSLLSRGRHTVNLIKRLVLRKSSVLTKPDRNMHKEGRTLKV